MKTDKVGQKVDKMVLLREQKRQLEEKIKKIQEQYNALQYKVIEEMELLGINSFKSELGSASVNEQIFFSIEDHETLMKYVEKEHMMGILAKTLNQGACRELLKEKNVIPPGCKTASKTKINLRQIAKEI